MTDRTFFALDSLRRFLHDARASRRITSIRDWDGGDALILRHDIDLDLSAAPAVALLEHELGIRSSFCCMTTSELYNVLAPENRLHLRELADHGFDVGLHFWPAAYPELDGRDAGALAERVAGEARLLEDIVGREVVSVSLHNPSASGRYPAFEGYRCAYDPPMFAPGRYLSDSRMVLREDPAAFVERTKGGVAQLLLHPEHFTASGSGYAEIFREIERRRAGAIDRYMLVNETYCAELPDGMFAALTRASTPTPGSP